LVLYPGNDLLLCGRLADDSLNVFPLLQIIAIIDNYSVMMLCQCWGIDLEALQAAQCFVVSSPSF